MTKVKVKKTRKFHSAEAWIVKDCQGNYVTSVEFLRDTPKNVKTAYYNKPALVLKDLESHGIKIKNSYTEDGELIVYVDESIFKEGK